MGDAWRRMTTKLVYIRQRQRHVGIGRSTWISSSNKRAHIGYICRFLSCLVLYSHVKSISRQQQQRYFPLPFYPWQCHSFTAINFLSVFVFCVHVRLGPEFLSLCRPPSPEQVLGNSCLFMRTVFIQHEHNEEKWSRKWWPNKIDSGRKKCADKKKMMSI